MKLAHIITAVALKPLVAVDLPHHGSNQHETNATAALREFFGTSERLAAPIEWIWLREDEEPERETGSFTFYDARERHPTRSEWRWYYSGEFLSRAEPGDVLALLRTADRRYLALLMQRESAWLRSVQELFGFSLDDTAGFRVIGEEALDIRSLGFTAHRILDSIGLLDELAPAALDPALVDDEALVLERFGMAFPTTQEMSAFAREHAGLPADADADEMLAGWIHREEQLFLALERAVVRERLTEGFAADGTVDVEGFLGFSLSVQNRRKARMGRALENHLAEVFRLHDIRCDEQARTEGKHRPDFLFPSGDAYHDTSFPGDLLTMLAAKSTCKERWRQILTEAQRIAHKHLCTLEPGISVDQTDQMREHRVTLVVPRALHATYMPQQQRELLTLSEFVNEVRERQLHAGAMR